MFLQTLLQLNILILATPALAGWSMMPLAQSGGVHAACIVWQCRTVEAIAPKTEQAQEELKERAAHPALVLPRLTPVYPALTPVQPGVFSPPTEAFVSNHPFPHATRAP